MPAVANVAVNVDARQANAGLSALSRNSNTASNSIRGTGRAAATATANIQRFGVSFRSVLGPVVALTGALTLGSRALAAFGQREADVKVLNAQLQRLGAGTAQLNELRKAADELGDATLFSEDDFVQAFNVLTSFKSIAVSSFKEVAETAADIAQVMGTDVKSATVQLAKALEDPKRGLTALSRSGITFNEAQTQTIKSLVNQNRLFEAQAQVLQIVQGQYENAARAAGTGFAGAVDLLKENTRDLLAALGGQLQPVVEKLTLALAKVFEKIKPELPTIVAGVTALLGPLVAIGQAVLPALKSAFNGVLANIKGIIQTAAFFATFIGVLKAIALATQAWAAATRALAAAQKAAAVAAAALQALGGPLGIAKVFAAIGAGAIAADQIGKAMDSASKSTKETKDNTADLDKNVQSALDKYKKIGQATASQLTQSQKIDEVLRNQDTTLTSVNAKEQMRLNAAQARMNNEATVANAMYGALLKVNDLEMQRAKNAGNTQREYQLQLQRAELIYKQSVLQVQQEIKKAELGALQVKIELQKLKAATQLKAAKGEATQADFDALALQQQAVELAYQGVDAARQAAAYHLQGANAIRQMTIEQAKFNSTQRAGAAGGAGAGTGGGGMTGGVRIDSPTPQPGLTRALAAAGLQGRFSVGEAYAQLAAIQAQKKQAYIAAQGGRQVTSIELARQGFAEGGFVTRPTNAMVGEGGQPEYVIPASKMNDAMRRYSAGTRGEAVVNSAGAPGSMSSTTNYSNQQNAYYGSGGGTSVNITTGPVMRLGNKNYVTVSDMQRGMAAAVGAAEANMMSRMSRSYAARRSMGL